MKGGALSVHNKATSNIIISLIVFVNKEFYSITLVINQKHIEITPKIEKVRKIEIYLHFLQEFININLKKIH